MQERVYNISEVVSFAKTSGRYGGLSNMAAGYPLFVNETNIPFVEVLYQTCKFPLMPAIQQRIAVESNPMRAKMISREYQAFARQDWDQIKFRVMEWCVRLKLLQNWDAFSELLLSTGDKMIVEYSIKDGVWGAIPDGNGLLVGINALGRILMKLRQEIEEGNFQKDYLDAPIITGFLLYGKKIGRVYTPEYYFEDFLI